MSGESVTDDDEGGKFGYSNLSVLPPPARTRASRRPGGRRAIRRRKKGEKEGRKEGRRTEGAFT